MKCCFCEKDLYVGEICGCQLKADSNMPKDGGSRFCVNCHRGFEPKTINDYLCEMCKEKVQKEYKKETPKQEYLIKSNKPLEDKIHNQKVTITYLQEVLRTKNLLLDGLLAVWCDGGCPGGIGRNTGIIITEETVILVEQNTKRLRKWWENKKYKDEYKKNTCK